MVRAHFGLATSTTTGALHAVAAIEIAAAVLVVLPSTLRILPSISRAAAGVIGGIATVAALRPSTGAGTGFLVADLAVLGLAAFVTWGGSRVCSESRGDR